MRSDIAATLQRAVELHVRGAAAEAVQLYATILEQQPGHADALHLLGVAETQLGRAQLGADLITRSLAINPDQPAAVANLGNALLALSRSEEALVAYEWALRLSPDYAPAHVGRGNALAQLGRAEAALSSYEAALQRAPNLVEALSGRGIALARLGRLDEALVSYERALSSKPSYVKALINRGAAYLQLERHAEALDDYDRALALHPDSAESHYGRGVALLGLQRPADALISFDAALRLTPADAKAFTGRGHALGELGQMEAAIVAYDRALEIDPELAPALCSRGIAVSIRGRYEEALTSFARLARVAPQFDHALGARLHAQLQLGDWRDYRETVDEVVRLLEADHRADFPFSLLAVCDSPPLQLRCGRQFAQKFRSASQPLWRGECYQHERIRVAYVCADFLEHPTAYLTAGLFEAHDRTRFETIAISLREDLHSPTARRVRAAFERYLAAPGAADAELARLIRQLEVDIAVDLMGYTGEHRANAFAYRPAPIQINYLGFPATTAAPHMDYILADDFLIPQHEQIHYSEQVVYLPDCFQANDNRKPAADRRPTRSAVGLPESAFVWCSFHSRYKINPVVFDVWMRLLQAVPDSVLWLVGGNRRAEDNLSREASARGVDPTRLVFGERLAYPLHLARLSLADLCLDTLPFNGGATTSDALWSGVPVVTCAGRGYAARMSGSLLRASGLMELVTTRLQDYERLALELARSPQRLAELRARLGRSRLESPLFDTVRFCRHLEAAYVTMRERAERRLRPASFRVAPLGCGCHGPVTGRRDHRDVSQNAGDALLAVDPRTAAGAQVENP